MKTSVIFLLLISVVWAFPAQALAERYVKFDNTLTVRIRNSTIGEEDVSGYLNYVKALYNEKRYRDATRLLSLITENYTGKLLPQVNFYKAKILFMEGRYPEFYESYRKNYLMFTQDPFVRGHEFTETLKSAIGKLAVSSPKGVDFYEKNVKTAVRLFQLHKLIAGTPDSEVQLVLNEMLNTSYTYTYEHKWDGKSKENIIGRCVNDRSKCSKIWAAYESVSKQCIFHIKPASDSTGIRPPALGSSDA